MKKSLLISFLLGILTFQSCDKIDTINEPDFNNKLLLELVESKDYAQLIQNNPLLESFGEVNKKLSNVAYHNMEGNDYPILSLIFSDGAGIKGQVIAIKIHDSGTKMKSGHTYAMVLKDFREFDFENKRGTVPFYDLNFGSYTALEMCIVDNIIKDVRVNEMPEIIAKKFNFKKSGGNHPCDSNNNGDVSFGECYSCLKEAIATDGTNQFICDALDVLFLCSSSVAAACLIVSGRN